MVKANRRFLSIFLLLLLSLSVSGCFEIKEVLSINKDGTGKYSLVMDFNQSKAIFQMILEMANSESSFTSELGGNPLNGLDSGFQEMSAYINSLQGISEAVSIRDENSFKFGMSFKFENIESLNLALAEMDASDLKTNYRPYYQYSKGRLEKSDFFNLENLGKEILSEDLQKSLGEDSYSQQLKDLSASVNYSIVIRTDGKIRRFSNEDAVLSQDKRELVYSKTLKQLMGNGIDISNEIRFR